jgi:uncharacterized protein YbgA (DUF1722 family)
MRIWDIDPGFLNDQSLLGEHRELHGIVSILKNNKKGYSRHPETLRWKSHLASLVVRHELLVEEMLLRGFKHHSPIEERIDTVQWPSQYIDHPAGQYELLRKKYLHRKQGRIVLPHNTQDLWASYKYSVMARDPKAGKEIGHAVAQGEVSFYDLSERVVQFLRLPPNPGRLRNAITHMWGYVTSFSELNPENEDDSDLLTEIQEKALSHDVDYLRRSTSLGELKFWCRGITKQAS